MILLVYLLYQVLALSHTSYAVSTAQSESLLSAAAGNRVTLKTKIAPLWVQSSETRGTSDILWSCLLTLIACVYTSLHLNLPPAHEKKSHYYLRRFKWVAIALFAPELVLYCALTQLLKARRLTKTLNELRAAKQAANESQASGPIPPGTSSGHDLEKGKGPVPAKKFPLRYGFFAVMGGIATDDVAKLKDDEHRSYVLTPDAILVFARRGTFFDFPMETISDKSKADRIGKLLVCMQLIWFFIQFITRAVASYPLTLIEVHTTAHVFCALSMYGLWWKKPQDISEPVSQDLSGCLECLAVALETSDNFERARLRYFGGKDGVRRSKFVGRWDAEEASDQSAKDTLRFRKLSEWLDMYQQQNPTKQITGPDRTVFDKLLWDHEIEYDMLTSHISNFPWALGSRRDHRSYASWVLETILDNKLLFIMLVVLSIIYGSIHLTVWNFRFASKTEYLLWRIASFDIMGTIPIGLLILLAFRLLAWLAKLAEEAIAKRVFEKYPNSSPKIHRLLVRFIELILGGWLDIILILLLLTPYTLSRYYLVVEAFISLRHVPIGVYAAVPWVQAIPHV